MAKQEQDREDLMREAVALVDRVELSVHGSDQLVTIGFRSNSAMSIFFGQDPVYQFDPEGLLRRAFVDGMLFRSQHDTLAMLKRERTENQTLLLRRDLPPEKLVVFRETMQNSLAILQQNLNAGQFTIVRSIPDAVDQILRIQSMIGIIRDASPWLSSAINRRR